MANCLLKINIIVYCIIVAKMVILKSKSNLPMETETEDTEFINGVV